MVFNVCAILRRIRVTQHLSFVTMALVDLTESTFVDQHLFPLIGQIHDHYVENQSKLRQMGAVVPGNDFWRSEFHRYTGTWPHSSIVAPLREIIQNSSDAGTSFLKISMTTVVTPASTPILGKQPSALFVSFVDDGKWCNPSVFDTYRNCCDYFLYMNGSSKRSVNGQDGGFGIGRFIILFVSSLWFFTVRHMLVVGHHGTYKILCRACLKPLHGPECLECCLHERNTPFGTTLFIHYPGTNDRFYRETAIDHFLTWCNTSFPILFNGSVSSMPIEKTIFQQGDLTVFKLEDNLVARRGTYIVRTHSGIPMFQKVIHNNNSESGFFIVELSPQVKYSDFNQSRSALCGDLATQFSAFMESRQGVTCSHDIKAELIIDLLGKSPLAILDIPILEEIIHTNPTVASGSLECFYYFRNGANMDNIDIKWRPQNSRIQVFLLLAWTETLYRVLKSQREHNHFSVGFVFDVFTMAMKRGDCYYINPVELEVSVCDIMCSDNHAQLSGYLMARAIHETAHHNNSDHDAAFASEMTHIAYASISNEMKTPAIAVMHQRIMEKTNQICKRRKIVVVDDDHDDDDCVIIEKVRKTIKQ